MLKKRGGAPLEKEYETNSIGRTKLELDRRLEGEV